MRSLLPDPLDLLGLPVHPLTMHQALIAVERAVDARGHAPLDAPFRHVALNAAKWVAASDDPSLSAAIRSADLVTADGVGVLALGRRLGSPLPERVTGIDLMDALCARAAVRGWPVYLLGGRPGVADAASVSLRRRYRQLKVAGTRHGYFPPSAEAEVAGEVARSGARLLFVGMNSPRKERFALQWGTPSAVDFVMGVGGAFDVLSGRLRRAPRLIQDLGLEWAWRWGQEPTRLAQRYGVDGARFVAQALVRARRVEASLTRSGEGGPSVARRAS